MRNSVSVARVGSGLVLAAGLATSAGSQDCANLPPPATCTGGIQHEVTYGEPPDDDTCFGCPLGSHNGTWSNASTDYRQLRLPRFDLGPGACGSLIQADVTVEYRSRTRVRVENLDDKPQPILAQLQQTGHLFSADIPALGALMVQNQFNRLFDCPGPPDCPTPMPVPPFDGTLDFAGNSGRDETTPEQVSRACFRFRTPAELAPFLNPTPGTPSFLLFDHDSTDQSAVFGPGNVASILNTTGLVRISVTYRSCECTVVAANDIGRVCTGSTVSVPVLSNDSTDCGLINPASLQFVGTPPAGFSLAGTNVVFNAAGVQPGDYVATYRVCNDQAPPCCDTATVTVTVCATTAVDDTARVCAGSSVTIPVLANDSTTCGALVPGSLAFVGTPPAGFSIVAGQIVYANSGTPSSGTVSATYQVCNNLAIPCCDTAVATVTICNVNAVDDTARVCAGSSVTVNVCANDTTNCGSLVPGSLSFVGTPPPGFAIVGSCQIRYTNSGTPSSGTVSATYQVCNNESPACCDTGVVNVTICNVNAVDDTARVCAGSSVTIPVLANDGTNCGALVPGTLSFVGTPPAGFSIAGGQVVYANSGSPSSGTVSATYQVCNNESPACCDSAVVAVTICSVNAVDDTARVCAGSSVTIPVLANDGTNCGALVPGSLSFVGTPPSGFSIVGGQIVYANNGTPGSGTVSATYRVCNNESPPCCDNATVTVTICSVTAVDDLARVCVGATVTIPVLANDGTNCGALVPGTLSFVGTPPAGFSIAGGQIVYANSGSPSSGTVSATYQVCNNESPACCDSAVVTVTICSVVAVDDTAQACAGTTITIPVLANDSTNCGALVPGSLSFVGTPPAGFSIAGGQVVYTNPGTPTSGTLTATYQVCNGETPPCCDTATVSVTICTVVAVDDPITICCGDVRSVAVLDNDSSTCGRIQCADLQLVAPVPPGFSVQGCNVVYDSNAGPCLNPTTVRYRIRAGTGLVCTAEANVIVTILSRPIAQDDTLEITGATTFPLDIDVLANDQPGAGCTFPSCTGCPAGTPCAVRIVSGPNFGTATVLMEAGCRVRYAPNTSFSTEDSFCYEVTNSCGCVDTACVRLSGCRQVDRATCASLLLYPEFDNRQGALTLFTLTNACCQISDGNLSVEMRFIDKETCGETDRTFTLTPCDTLSFLTSAVDPNGHRGYAYAFAKRLTPGPGNPNGMPIVRNKLIGQLLVIDGIEALDYSLNAVSFLGLGDEGSDNDEDGDGIRDLNGPHPTLAEYEQAPDEILIPRFLGQDPPGMGPRFDSQLLLIALTGGSAFTTNVRFLVYNDSEDAFSHDRQFFCWDKRPLIEWAPSTQSAFLTSVGDDPDEILGATDHVAGWIRLDGLTASSSQETITDPAIYAVLIESFDAYNVADLPFELCSQANGDLLPVSPLGDGPNPVAGDDQ